MVTGATYNEPLCSGVAWTSPVALPDPGEGDEEAAGAEAEAAGADD